MRRRAWTTEVLLGDDVDLEEAEHVFGSCRGNPLGNTVETDGMTRLTKQSVNWKVEGLPGPMRRGVGLVGGNASYLGASLYWLG